VTVGVDLVGPGGHGLNFPFDAVPPTTQPVVLSGPRPGMEQLLALPFFRLIRYRPTRGPSKNRTAADAELD
jgi:hypothetical protein